MLFHHITHERFQNMLAKRTRWWRAICKTNAMYIPGLSYLDSVDRSGHAHEARRRKTSQKIGEGGQSLSFKGVRSGYRARVTKLHDLQYLHEMSAKTQLDMDQLGQIITKAFAACLRVEMGWTLSCLTWRVELRENETGKQ
jgi:hypothetical protein